MQKFIAGSLLLAGFNAQSQAQENPTNNALELPNMVVTATRTEVAKNQLASAATVYTRKDIERLQVRTLPELLRGTTGVDIVQSGGYGQPSSVFMRGTDSNHVLVLIDGIKVGSATLGSSPFELIPIDQVDRVEIIRGPQSSLYGSEALGGVIQIFTRKGKQLAKPSVTLDAGGGSYDTYSAAGTVSGKWQNSWYTLGASSIGSKGFNAKQSPADSDPDGYQNTALNARVGHRFDSNAELEAFFMRAEGTNEFDGYFTGDIDNKEFVEQIVGASGSMNVTDNWHSILRFGQSRDDQDFFKPGHEFDSRYNTTRWNSSWLNELTLSDDHQLVLGADYRVDEVESSIAYKETSRYDVGVFTELRSQILDDHFLTAAVRWDENQAFGDYVTGNVGWRYNWNYGISLLANFGNAFRAPTFNELYWPATPASSYYPGDSGGNPNLKPEESKSVEAGISGDHDWGKWEVRAYHTDIDNLIGNWPPENVSKAQIDGIETEIAAQLLGWNATLNLNLLNPKDRETNNRLKGRADKMLSFDLSRSFGQFDLGTHVVAQGGRDYYFYDENDNFAQKNKTISGFVTVDLRSAYHLNKNWMLNAKLSNLLDDKYQTVNTYNTAGRNFFFSIHYNN